MVVRRPPSERGLSVLEMVIGLALLGVVAAGLVAAQTGAMRYARVTHDRTVLLRACAARLELHAATGRAPETGERVFDLPPVFAERFRGAVGREVVRPAGPGLVSVETRVEWVLPGGDIRAVRLSTLIAREEER